MSQLNAEKPFKNAHDQASIRRDPATVLTASTFSAGILLLPTDLRRDARRLYGVLRTIDDLVDERDPGAQERVEAIQNWALGRETDTPETHTLQRLAEQYPLSREAFLDFCQGMRHDLNAETISTESDLERYCRQAGGTVGIMLAGLLGTSHPDGEDAMSTLGAAMQHTNILRDIDEDATHGRLYIPQSNIERFGAPQPGAREELLRYEISRADALYEIGAAAIPLLRRGRDAMMVSAALYREILRQIEHQGYGRTAGRVKVPNWRKRYLLAQPRFAVEQTHHRSPISARQPNN